MAYIPSTTVSGYTTPTASQKCLARWTLDETAAPYANAEGVLTLAYTGGGTYQVQDGDVVTQGGASATVRTLSLASGTWAGGRCRRCAVSHWPDRNFQRWRHRRWCPQQRMYRCWRLCGYKPCS